MTMIQSKYHCKNFKKAEILQQKSWIKQMSCFTEIEEYNNPHKFI